MNVVRRALGAGENLLDRVLCVFGAVLFSQAPEFMQQYRLRVGGHLDEARRILLQFRHTAEQSGLSLDQFILQTRANAEPSVARLGDVMAEAAARVDHLAAAQAAIQNAGPFTRPFAFLGHLDPAIARATWSIFVPAVPTTFEGLMYAVCGMVALLAVYHLGLRRPVVRYVERRRARRIAPAAPPVAPA